jgi:hypothetical protein
MPGAARSADLSRSTLADSLRPLLVRARFGGPFEEAPSGLADDLGEATYPDRVEVGEGLLFVVGSRRVSLPLG